MAYDVRFGHLATEELGELRAFDRKAIVEAAASQLSDQPTTPAKNRKCLKNVEPGFEHRPPLWELRVGEYRVFYDVDEDAEEVTIRAVRRKRPKDRTEDIIK